MSHFHRNFEKGQTSRSSYSSNMPASKRPRISSGRMEAEEQKENDEDPFADDITGEELEEWEYAASQAEIRLTQEQTKVPTKHVNGQQFNGRTNGTSFKIPPAKTNHVKSSVGTNNMQFNNTIVKELQVKFAKCETELKDLEHSYKRKDGETLVLRDRLSKAEKDLNQERKKNFELQQRHEEAEAEREKRIQKELEKFKDQVQFKQAEILESQNLIKNLETKNKLLEQYKSGQQRGTSGTTLSHRTNSVDMEWSGTQDSTTVVAKKIRLVKPESPRVSVSGLGNKPTFDDEPLARKKATKPSSSSPSTRNTSPTKPDTSIKNSHMDEKTSSRLKLKSKYLSKDFSKQTTFQVLLGSSSQKKLNCDDVDINSPVFHLLHSRNDKRNVTAGCLTGLLSNIHVDKIFGNVCQTKHCPISSAGENHEILNFIDNLLCSYVNLQDSLTRNQLISQNSSSFHTAPSEQSVGDSAVRRPASKEELVDLSSISKDTVAALQVLLTLTKSSNVLTVSLLNQSTSILSNLLKMCDMERWHSKLEHCLRITMLSLEIVANIAKLGKGEIHMKKFQPIMKTELVISLLSHENIQMKLVTMDVLTSLVYHSEFALIITKAVPDTSNILCRICDFACSQLPENVMLPDWVCLLSKVLTFLSILVAEHENSLVENSCYSEIYRAADVLLYNELVGWKNSKQTNVKRLDLIKRALCLLHSCANVYSDGIPGSRRDHRHQFVLTNLDDFLTKYANKSSFWYQELSRIVKSEVEALFDEVEIT